MVCLYTLSKEKKSKKTEADRKEALANYSKLIFVFPAKQKSSASSTEASKSKYLVTELCRWGRTLFA